MPSPFAAAGTWLRNQISAAVPSSKVTRCPCGESVARTASGTEASLQGPMVSSLDAPSAAEDAIRMKQSNRRRRRMTGRSCIVNCPITRLRNYSIPRSLSEAAHKRAAFVVQGPGDAQVGTAVFIGQGHGGHGVGSGSQRRIERDFIAAEVIVLI